jgi:hypothetical protein
MEATMQVPTIETVASHPAVYSSKEWQSGHLRRCYLNLRGFNARFVGDRNTKVYFDHSTSELVVTVGKGTMSDELWASIRALRADFATAER